MLDQLVEREREREREHRGLWDKSMFIVRIDCSSSLLVSWASGAVYLFPLSLSKGGTHSFRVYGVRVRRGGGGTKGRIEWGWGGSYCLWGISTATPTAMVLFLHLVHPIILCFWPIWSNHNLVGFVPIFSPRWIRIRPVLVGIQRIYRTLVRIKWILILIIALSGCIGSR